MSPHPSRIPWLLRGLAIAGAVVMSLSLFLGFLDPLVTGTWSGTIGVDFFGVPQAWINLLHGESIYCRMPDPASIGRNVVGDFGPYAAWYPYHPLLAVVVGSWTAMLRPVASYLAFVFVSFLLLWLSAAPGRPARGRRNGQGLGVFRGLRRAADLFPAVERADARLHRARGGRRAGRADRRHFRKARDWGLGIRDWRRRKGD